jgi:hypothetical protein
MNRQNPPTQRTDWAERHVEELLSLPFVTEFVFRSPQTIDRTLKREVADFLILQKGTGILISQKCQEDPARRTVEQTNRWARKKAKELSTSCAGHFGVAPGGQYGVTILAVGESIFPKACQQSGMALCWSKFSSQLTSAKKAYR